MRQVGLAVALLLFGGHVVLPLPAAASTLYSISRDDNQLREINPVDGTTVGVPVSITLPGKAVVGGTGLATDPLTGDLYALLKILNQGPRELVTIDPATGAATFVGNTGGKFATLAFDSGGTLYAATGSGAGPPVTPNTLYTLSLIDATRTSVTTLLNSTQGEAIGFNPDDGFLYHASGYFDVPLVGDTRIFEKIDLNTLVATNIPLSGDFYTEITALVFSGNSFFGADTGFGAPGDIPIFLSLTDGGAVGDIGPTDHVVKGLAFVPEPSSSLMLMAGVGFLAGLDRRRTQRPR
jgi:hypothetical protein